MSSGSGCSTRAPLIATSRTNAAARRMALRQASSTVRGRPPRLVLPAAAARRWTSSASESLRRFVTLAILIFAPDCKHAFALDSTLDRLQVASKPRSDVATLHIVGDLESSLKHVTCHFECPEIQLVH